MQERKNLLANYKLSMGSSVLLDLIRGVSAQLVVVGHAISMFEVFHVLHPPTTPWMQEIAVLIFFLLSGFLISYSTARKMLGKREYDFGYFFIDRFSRIYTAFIPVLIFVLVVDLVSIYIGSDAYIYHEAFSPITFLVNLLQLQDFPVLKISSYLKIIPAGMTTSFGSARPFWTLAVEWWIYMFFGYFIIVFINQKKLNLRHLIILGFLSIVPVFNLIDGRGHGLMMYWLFGAVIYVISTYNFLSGIPKYVKRLLIFMLLVCAIIRGAILTEEYDPILAFILVTALWLLIDFYKEKNFSVTSTKAVKYLASYSFTLYLVHYSVIDFMFVHFKSYDPYALCFGSIVISNIISIIIGRYTEEVLTPIIKKKLYDYKNARNPSS